MEEEENYRCDCMIYNDRILGPNRPTASRQVGPIVDIENLFFYCNAIFILNSMHGCGPRPDGVDTGDKADP